MPSLMHAHLVGLGLLFIGGSAAAATAAPAPGTGAEQAGGAQLSAAAKGYGPQKVSEEEARQMFEANCGACHSLDLPRGQRLSRDMWEWVMKDMVTQFGATWITPEQQQTIVDYLAEHYGPDRPR